MQLLFNAMTIATFLFLDINGVVTNPSFKTALLPIIVLIIIFLSFRYIMNLFQDYLKSEFDSIIEQQNKLLANDKKEIESLISNLKEFKENKYVLRDIQAAINDHARIIYELIGYSHHFHNEGVFGGIKDKYKPKKINLIDIPDEHNPDNE